MTALTPEIVDDVIAACRASADEIVAALSRALDTQFLGVTIGEATTYDPQAPPAGFDGAGLAFVFQCGEASAVAVLPESCGLLPDWYLDLGATGQSKLSALAQELSLLLLPESYVVDDFHVVPLASVAPMLERAAVAAAAPLVPFSLRHANCGGQISLLWPVAKHETLLPIADLPGAESTSESQSQQTPPADESLDQLAHLPRYARSFLKVQVPVSVHLAGQKCTVKEILELVPGAIIKFDRPCDDLLDLVVCDQPIATGEVVKVDDKFGLRIRSMILPHEQFVAIHSKMAS